MPAQPSPLEAIAELQRAAEQQLAQASTTRDLELVRVEFMGRKGPLATIMKSLGAVDPALRPQVGHAANRFKVQLESALHTRATQLAPPPSGPRLDVTLPGAPQHLGRPHPIMRVLDELVALFGRLGFRTVEGPEVEQEFYNFDALNIPRHHPSRDGFETFYLDVPTTGKHGRWLLRSHTSPVQIRAMQRATPPLAIVVPGSVFRPDAVDASHACMFHQLEGLFIDRDVTFAQLRSTLELFIREFFGPQTRSRFRPHYFPFTEPSAEVDIACHRCQGDGCAVCGRKGWLEILGCGMVHPHVFRAVGYPANRWTGFAFGLGIERMIMLKYGIDDIRLLYENDLRFLEQL